jgi:hypothetical protein
VFDAVRSHTTFDARRLGYAAVLAAFVVALDALFLHLSTFRGASDVVLEVGIHTLGIYLGLTMVAVLNDPEREPRLVGHAGSRRKRPVPVR